MIWFHGPADAASASPASVAGNSGHRRSATKRDPRHSHSRTPPAFSWGRIVCDAAANRYCDRACSRPELCLRRLGDAATRIPRAQIEARAVRRATPSRARLASRGLDGKCVTGDGDCLSV